MNTLVSNIDVSGTLITLDIAKKHHDAKIRHRDGRTSYLRIENTLEGFNRLLALTASPHEDIIVAFEPTADYHRNIAWWLHKQGVQCHLVSFVRCARAREMLFRTWDKNDRKDASVIMYLLEQGLSSPFYDPLANGIIDIQEISNTYHQVTLARTRCLNSLVNHYLTLYFPEAEQFLHMSRAEWFCQFLLQFPTPSCITSLNRDVFVKQSWDVVGRKQYKQQFLEHLYDVARIPLHYRYQMILWQWPRSDYSFIDISNFRPNDYNLRNKQKNICRNEVTPSIYVRSRGLDL